MDRPFAAYQGAEPYVFVCYAHDDAERIYPELAWLNQASVNIWYDEGISAGRVWRAEIAEAIEGAGGVLFYVSRSSLESDHCNREIHFALDQGVPVLPVYLEDVELTADLRMALAPVQALFRERDATYRAHLLDALRAPVSRRAAARSKALPRRARRLRYGAAGLALSMLVAGAWFTLRESAPTPPASMGRDAEAPTRIAVLPFENLSDEESDVYFSEGFADEVLNRLTHIRNLRVISRRASFRYGGSDLDVRSVGAELGADYLLEGSVRRAGNVVRVNARLIDTTDESQIWSESFDDSIENVLRMEAQIARRAASEVASSIEYPPTEEREVDPRAYELYLQGRAALAEGTYPRARDLHVEATQIDPMFANAYAGAARATMALRPTTRFEDRAELTRLARRYAALALELDPRHAEARYVDIMTDMGGGGGGLQGLFSRLEELIREFPNYTGPLISYAIMLHQADRQEELLAVQNRLRELEPKTIPTLMTRRQVYINLGRFDEEPAVREEIKGIRPDLPWPDLTEFFTSVVADWPEEIEAYLEQAAEEQRALLELYLSWRRNEGEVSRAAYDAGVERLSDPMDEIFLNAWLLQLLFDDTDAAMALLGPRRPLEMPALQNLRSFTGFWLRNGNARERRAAETWRADPRFQARLGPWKDATVDSLVLANDLF